MERYFALIGRGGAKPLVLVNKCDLFPKRQNEEAAASIRALCPRPRSSSPARSTAATSPKSAASSRRASRSPSWDRAARQKLARQRPPRRGLAGGGRGQRGHRQGPPHHHRPRAHRARGGRHPIDNPGIREVQMWTDEHTLREKFLDVAEIAAECRSTTAATAASRMRHPRGRRRGPAPARAARRLPQARRGDREPEKAAQETQMTLERRAKRDHRVKARNLADRRDHEAELKPRPTDT